MKDRDSFDNLSLLMHIQQLQTTVRLATFVRRMNAGDHISGEDWDLLGEQMNQLIERSQELLAKVEGVPDGN